MARSQLGASFTAAMMSSISSRLRRTVFGPRGSRGKRQNDGQNGRAGSKTHCMLLLELTLGRDATSKGFKRARRLTGFLLDVLARQRRQPAAFCERDLTVSDLATLEQTILSRYRRRRRRSRPRSRARRSARQEGLDLRAARHARQDVAGRTQDAGRRDQPRQGQGHAGAFRAPRHPEIGGARCPACLRDHRRHAAAA